MEELHFTGNCLKGSRPILSFDAAFEKQAHLRVIKELFLHTFGVPQGARKSKPFIDHVMTFSIADGEFLFCYPSIAPGGKALVQADSVMTQSPANTCAGKIWVRNYQINEVEPTKTKTGEEIEEAAKEAKSKSRSIDTDIQLTEIGPRFVLTPIVIQEGSMGGPILYENRSFVSPNQVRADLRKSKASKHNARAEQTVERLSRRGELGLRSEGGTKAPRDELDTKMLFA